MKTLGNLKPAPGSNQRKKRLGRGIGSNWGKTAGKGHKGQKARKGGGIAPGFEGGQMPIYRRLPKRGFKNYFRKNVASVNVDELNRFDGSVSVTPEILLKAGLIPKNVDIVKLLGRGALDKGLSITVHKASESAKKAVEKAGGKLEFIPTPKKNTERAKGKKQEQK